MNRERNSVVGEATTEIGQDWRGDDTRNLLSVERGGVEEEEALSGINAKLFQGFKHMSLTRS